MMKMMAMLSRAPMASSHGVKSFMGQSGRKNVVPTSPEVRGAALRGLLWVTKRSAFPRRYG